MTQIKGKSANRVELAQFFGVSVMTIDTWIRKGMPIVQRGSRGVSWEFDTAACAQWRADQAALNAVGDTTSSDMEELKRRKAAAETALVELELSRERGKVIAVEDFDKLLSPMVIAYRSTLLNLPSKLHQFVDEEAEKIIDSEIRLALEALSEYEFESLSDDAGGDDGGDSSPDGD